jgi:hypothetical protein
MAWTLVIIIKTYELGDMLFPFFQISTARLNYMLKIA